MAKIIHYQPEFNTKFLCHKGGLHSEQSLNIVCLDPLCRNDPFGCSICFTNIHKYHRVVSVDKFFDDYTKNVREVSTFKNMKKIQKHHSTVRQLIKNLRKQVNQQLQNFQESIDEYANQLKAKLNLRENISKTVKIQLEPSRIKTSKSPQQFVGFVKFILNNACFDKNNNMIQVADVLKQDQQRIYSLLDRMVNMTQGCQQHIKQVMKSLKFSDQTLNKQKIQYKKTLDQLKSIKNGFDTQKFIHNQTFHKTLQQKSNLQKIYWRNNLLATHSIKDTNQNIQQQVKLTFSNLKKHQMIQLQSKAKIGISNITALKPQYALLTPHLSTMPTEVKEWTIKINNCRNFASENTIGIGLATQKQLKNSKYEGSIPKNVCMLTSQGYLLQNGQSRKTNVIFGTGDTIHCKYDPFYQLLEISKENGRLLAIKVQNPEDEELYACVRLTYASDQVQIL